MWAHRLAVAVIDYQTGSGFLADDLQAIAALLDTDPDTPPADVEQVIATVEQIDGVRLAALLDHLPHRAPDNQTAMAAVLDLAHATRRQAGAEHRPADPGPTSSTE